MEEEINVLSNEQINTELKDLPGWKIENNKMMKTFKFGTMDDSVDFVHYILPFCNKIDYHPDIQINYAKAKFELCRWDVGCRISNRDILVAHHIENVYSSWH